MKKTLSVLLIAALLAVALTGCSRGYKISVVSGEKFLDQCPRRAQAGETVTVTTLCVTDGDMYVAVNGDSDYGRFVRDSVYEFVMPAEDVEISITFISNGLA